MKSQLVLAAKQGHVVAIDDCSGAFHFEEGED